MNIESTIFICNKIIGNFKSADFFNLFFYIHWFLRVFNSQLLFYFSAALVQKIERRLGVSVIFTLP